MEILWKWILISSKSHLFLPRYMENHGHEVKSMLHVVDLFCPPLNLKPWDWTSKGPRCYLPLLIWVVNPASFPSQKKHRFLGEQIHFRLLKSPCFSSMKSVFVQGIPLWADADTPPSAHQRTAHHPGVASLTKVLECRTSQARHMFHWDPSRGMTKTWSELAGKTMECSGYHSTPPNCCWIAGGYGNLCTECLNEGI